MEKRGQTEIGIGTLLLIAFGVVALVIVIVGFTGGWYYIFDKLGILPNQLEAAAQSCKFSAEQKLATSYCNEFKEIRIAGKKQFANCDYLATNKIIDIGGISLECTGATYAETYCTQLETSLGDKFDENVLVNGASCKDLGVTSTE